MTLRELADQLNRPMGEIVKALTRNGFKGIYKNNHQVPSDAVQVVIDVITNGENNLNALPSANPDTIQVKQETPVTVPSGNAGATESLLQQTSQAMVATADHVATERNQQLISNAEVLAISDAIGSNLAYKRAYAETMQTLAVLDAKAQEQLLTELTNRLNNPDFFGSKTTQETFYATSQNTAVDTAKDLRSMVKNLSY
jgi:hypothetical protein